ncbi:MAG TPA: hypothetical protein VK151_11490 [Fluviicola sp.]|nr:hypothetical protein [Fluviicola sp.]
MRKLLVVFGAIFLAAVAGMAQTNSSEAKILNYTDFKQVKQFDKLEVGVKLPNNILVRVNNFLSRANVAQSEKINPFLQWELEVEAVMTHPETGTVKKIPGFYYREYERDKKSNSWKDVGTQFPMRIRFSPPLPGYWTCEIKLKVKETTVDELSDLRFNVVKSDNKGFVSVHSNKRNFQLDGKMIYPVGINFPSPTKNVNNYHTAGEGNPDHFSPKETHKVTKLSEWLTYHNDIQSYSDQGGKYIRVLQSGWSSLIEFEEKGNYYDRQPYAWEQDRLLEFCEQNGVYIHFNFMQQEPVMNYGNYDMFDWDWTHYNGDKSYFAQDAFPAYCYADDRNKQPHEMLTNEDDVRYHEQRVRYYIARYGYSTSIYLFELLSEPWHVDEFSGYEEPFATDDEHGKIVRKAVQQFHEHMATYIKQTLGHTNQLVGIDIYTAKFYEGETFIDQSIYHPEIDVVSFNPYTPSPDKMVIAKSEANNQFLSNENSMARMVSSLAAKAGKPIMIAEGGAGDGVDDCCNYAQQYLDMMSFGFVGLAGYNSWIGWNKGHEVTWPAMIACQQFMNSEQTLATLSNTNGYWVQGRQAERHLNRDSKKGKETQYYVSQDETRAVGYVKNRSYNFFTKRTSDACGKASFEAPFNELRDMKWDDGNRPLYVEGLAKGKNYQVTWYDYNTGKEIETQCAKLKRGKLRLRFPELSVTAGKPERPEVWFSVVQSDCDL